MEDFRKTVLKTVPAVSQSEVVLRVEMKLRVIVSLAVIVCFAFCSFVSAAEPILTFRTDANYSEDQFQIDNWLLNMMFEVPKTRFGTGKKAGETKKVTIKGVDYLFRWCPPGEFMMGSPDSEVDHEEDEQLHKVRLSRGFWLLESEVTVEMFTSLMKPETVKDQKPYDSAEYHEAISFCYALSKELDNMVILPTEAQWEYACRAGTTGEFAGTGNINEMGWYAENSDNVKHNVKEKKPNAWGLYDMHGNVREWCLDVYSKTFYERSHEHDPLSTETARFEDYDGNVCRGGYYGASAWKCRSASRSSNGGLIADEGFRPLVYAYAEAPPKYVKALGTGNRPGEKKTLTLKGVDYTFCWCPSGKFTMGSERSSTSELHQVTLSRGFWILESEVTQEMWESVMGTAYWKFVRGPADPLFPMYYVSWDEVNEFCAKLRSVSGLPVTLPTEAQWEYACRAGTTGDYGGTGRFQEMGWWSGSIREVKKKMPNDWGIYDMNGNVGEWCSDWFAYFEKSPQTDPKGPVGGNHRDSPKNKVYRGGGETGSDYETSGSRLGSLPSRQDDRIGFRIVIPSESVE